MSSQLNSVPALYVPNTPLPIDDPQSGALDALLSRVPGFQPCTKDSAERPDAGQWILHQMWGQQDNLAGWTDMKTIPTGFSSQTLTRLGEGLIPSEIFLFSEYMIHVFPRVEAILRHPEPGAIVIGTPGIGKTIFLYLHLILSLVAKRSILFHQQGDLYMHSHKGVHRLSGADNIKRFLDLLPLRGMVLLVDMDWEPNTKPMPLDPSSRILRVVGASALDSPHYDHFIKRGYSRVVMNPPSREELKLYYQHTAFTEPGPERGQPFNFDQQLDTGIAWMGFNLLNHRQFMQGDWSQAADRAEASVRYDMTSHSRLSSYRGVRQDMSGDTMMHVPCSVHVFSALRLKAMLARKSYSDVFTEIFHAPARASAAEAETDSYDIYTHEQICFKKQFLDVTLQHGDTPMRIVFRFDYFDDKKMQAWEDESWSYPIMKTRTTEASATQNGIEKLKKIRSRVPGSTAIYLIFVVQHDEDLTYPEVYEGVVYGVARMKGLPRHEVQTEKDFWERLRTAAHEDEDELMSDAQ